MPRALRRRIARSARRDDVARRARGAARLRLQQRDEPVRLDRVHRRRHHARRDRPLHEHRGRRHARDGRDLRSDARRSRRGRRDRSDEPSCSPRSTASRPSTPTHDPSGYRGGIADAGPERRHLDVDRARQRDRAHRVPGSRHERAQVRLRAEPRRLAELRRRFRRRRAGRRLRLDGDRQQRPSRDRVPRGRRRRWHGASQHRAAARAPRRSGAGDVGLDDVDDRERAGLVRGRVRARASRARPAWRRPIRSSA